MHVGQDGGRVIGLRRHWADTALLTILVGFTLLVIAGYASFGRHPALVASVPGAAQWYGVALRFFPIVHVWLAFAVIAIYMTRKVGGHWIGAFALLYAVSLTSELVGTGYGIPFGAYHYTQLLGAEWLGRVPGVIPLSWFSMSVSSYAIAGEMMARHTRDTGAIVNVWKRILLASLLLLCWDLALDPAMSHATIYWVWGASGPYYGMPWSNLAGWYLTGIVLTAVLVPIHADRWIVRLSPRWLAGFYGANLLLALGMDVAAGLWLAVAATLVALGAACALMDASGRRTRSSDTSVITAAVTR